VNLSPPTCPLHGTMAMPMLNPGHWWCPKGWHIVVTFIASTPAPIPRAA